jgi:hypothetical protein
VAGDGDDRRRCDLLWDGFAEQLDVVPKPSVPILLLVIVVAVAIVVANLAAALPGRMARRVRPATALSAE